jgi:hypothetical protein
LADIVSIVTQRNRGLIPSVPDGWRPILRRLIDQFDRMPNVPEIRYAKEKFGELVVTIVAETATDLSRALVASAKIEAARTCATCGKPGDYRSTEDGTLMTLCDTHGPSDIWRKVPRPTWTTIGAVDDGGKK